MEHTARLFNPRAVLVPAIALAIGAAGAVGVYAVVDDTDVDIQPTRVVVADPPAKPGEGVAAKHESATAAAIAGSSSSSSLEGKDEAATAAAIGADEARRGGGPPAESDDYANRTDPHGPAAALP
jgi:hypothetical protein